MTARLEQTIASVGFPILQASLSTILCVSSLFFVDLHMSQVSWRQKLNQRFYSGNSYKSGPKHFQVKSKFPAFRQVYAAGRGNRNDPRPCGDPRNFQSPSCYS